MPSTGRRRFRSMRRGSRSMWRGFWRRWGRRRCARGVWGGGGGEPWRQVMNGVNAPGRAGALIMKLNALELAETLRREAIAEGDLQSAMRDALPKNAWLVVTLGKEGAIATDGAAFFRVTTPPI